MAGFTATASALRCAAAIQRAVADAQPRRRVSLSLCGSRSASAMPSSEDGDLQGTAVVEAARLCAIAERRARSSARTRCGPCPPTGRAARSASRAVSSSRACPGPWWSTRSSSRAARRPGPGGAGLVPCPRAAVRVERDGAPVAVGGPKEQLVLAILLASAGTSVSVGSIVDAVWGERPPRTAERTVHAYVARLRRALEAEVGPDRRHAVIETVGRGYRLRHRAGSDRRGSVRAARAGGRGPARRRESGHRGDRASSTRWRSGGVTPMTVCRTSGRAPRRRARLEGLRLVAVEDRVDADLAAGEAAALVPELEAAVGEQPFRERRWAQLMLALYRSGRQGEAIDAYQRARRALVDELGIEPGPDLRRLEAAVLAQDSVAGRAGTRPGVGPPAGCRPRSARWVPRSSAGRPRPGVARGRLGGRGRRARRLRVGAWTRGDREDPAGRRAGAARSTPTVRPCSTAAATTPTGAPVPCSGRPCRAPGPRSPTSTGPSTRPSISPSAVARSLLDLVPGPAGVVGARRPPVGGRRGAGARRRSGGLVRGDAHARDRGVPHRPGSGGGSRRRAGRRRLPARPRPRVGRCGRTDLRSLCHRALVDAGPRADLRADGWRSAPGPRTGQRVGARAHQPAHGRGRRPSRRHPPPARCVARRGRRRCRGHSAAARAAPRPAGRARGAARREHDRRTRGAAPTRAWPGSSKPTRRTSSAASASSPS